MRKEKIIYEKGHIFGKVKYLNDTKITIKQDSKRKRYRRYANFLCECGNIFESNIDWVKQGRVQSCGCLQKRQALKRLPSPLKHGHSVSGYKTPEYKAWLAMKSRCNGKNLLNFKAYKNIKVCDRWINSFENFIKDMGYKPSSEHSLDRINTNGNYCPENCRWATTAEQNSNKKNNVQITFKGETHHLAFWARKFNISSHTLSYRIANNWPIDILFSPVSKNIRVTEEARQR